MTQLNKIQQQFVDAFATDPEVISLIKDIEARPKTTRNHYGDYGAAISKLCQGSKIAAQLLALAFVKAGADYIGVTNGLNVLVLGEPPIMG